MAWDRVRRLLKVAGVAVLGGLIGLLVAAVWAARAAVMPSDHTFLSQAFPMPHHVPARPDGIAFRFAMVHDVLVERYLKHDSAYYQARERVDRLRLVTLKGDDPERFAVLDDLGVDLERLGRSAEAVDLMRAKLRDQEQAGLAGRALYTTYADLGTFLIHDSLKPALAGDAPARDRFGEGVRFIRRSVEVNPDAHFGRERWQASVASFLRAAMDDPNLLTTFDCLGNWLDLPVEQILNRDLNWWTDQAYGRPNLPALGQWEAQTKVPAYFEPGQAVADPARRAAVLPVRDYITRIGAEHGWEALGEKIPDHQAPVAFDEPMLGIVGMWRQGGGANPHFALAIGETMLRVGQRRIAWEAFERAALLAERFSPQTLIQDRLRNHCKARQAAIEATLNYRRAPTDRHPWQEISPPRTDDAPEQLRARFRAELQFGLDTQKRYQDFERERLRSGVAVDDPHLDDGFAMGPTPLASRSGPEEWFQTVTPEAVVQFGSRYSAATATLGAGVAAFLAALAGRLRLAFRAQGETASSQGLLAATAEGDSEPLP